MTRLKSVYNKWNSQQQAYYEPVLAALSNNNIMTDDALLEKEFDILCQLTSIARPRLRAFVKQIQFDTMIPEETYSEKKQLYISSGFERLDQMLQNGLLFGQVNEICAETNAIPSRLISYIFTSYLMTYSIQSVFVFDTTGMLEPRSMNDTFIKRNVDPQLLANIDCTQSFTLSDLSSSLENLAAILSTSKNTCPLVVIDDLARLIVNNLVKMIQVLAKKLNCCVIILHHTLKAELSSVTQKPYDLMVDLRLFLSPHMDQPKYTTVEVLKSRKWVIMMIITN
ncbi:hypothetical protein BD560DRAFT_438605 [Blakeslea trispora]|nr:hypothetical protein BD560DRAFT_438605 [Blakeslea trispora]